VVPIAVTIAKGFWPIYEALYEGQVHENRENVTLHTTQCLQRKLLFVREQHSLGYMHTNIIHIMAQSDCSFTSDVPCGGWWRLSWRLNLGLSYTVLVGNLGISPRIRVLPSGTVLKSEFSRLFDFFRHVDGLKCCQLSSTDDLRNYHTERPRLLTTQYMYVTQSVARVLPQKACFLIAQNSISKEIAKLSTARW